jgi:hypothetical protein
MDLTNPDVMTSFAIFFFIALSVIAKHRNKPYLKTIAWIILVIFGFILPLLIGTHLISI